MKFRSTRLVLDRDVLDEGRVEEDAEVGSA